MAVLTNQLEEERNRHQLQEKRFRQVSRRGEERRREDEMMRVRFVW